MFTWNLRALVQKGTVLTLPRPLQPVVDFHLPQLIWELEEDRLAILLETDMCFTMLLISTFVSKRSRESVSKISLHIWNLLPLRYPFSRSDSIMSPNTSLIDNFNHLFLQLYLKLTGAPSWPLVSHQI